MGVSPNLGEMMCMPFKKTMLSFNVASQQLHTARYLYAGESSGRRVGGGEGTKKLATERRRWRWQLKDGSRKKRQ